MVSKKIKWTDKTKDLVKILHKEISLSNYNWHELKGLPERRAAELLTAALSQLINDGKASDIEDLISQAKKWLKKEVRDPGCSRN
tara:strand:+ start:16118 stop:16372 length:255 start_codon:yes stop_codon:yes gene_type:complete